MTPKVQVPVSLADVDSFTVELIVRVSEPRSLIFLQSNVSLPAEGVRIMVSPKVADSRTELVTIVSWVISRWYNTTLRTEGTHVD